MDQVMHMEAETGMSTGLLEIGAVARELGVAPSTLRTWERRYGRVVPHRGEHGQRLYDPDQVVQLRRVLTMVRRGARAGAAHDLASIPRPVGTCLVRIDPSPTAAREARRAIDDLVGESEGGSFHFYLRLIASELVKNAFLYGSGKEPIVMEVRLFSDLAEIQVRNAGGPLTMKSLRRRRREGGRGLEIIDAVANGWSIDTGPPGTNITIRLTIDDD
jgi:hypothetical protein